MAEEPPLKRQTVRVNKNEALWEAIVSNNLENAEKLLEEGANPNYKSFGIPISFHVKSPEMINLIIRKGADINLKSDQNESLLSYVVNYPDYANENIKLEIMEVLLREGADPFTVNERDEEEVQYSLSSCGEMCKKILARYRWKILYERDKETALRYGRSTKVPKDVWQIILLNKRQQLLCKNLNSNKNKEILYLFALDVGVPSTYLTQNITKAELCKLISRYIVS